jgi:hypothetical protein
MTKSSDEAQRSAAGGTLKGQSTKGWVVDEDKAAFNNKRVYIKQKCGVNEFS